MSKPEAFRAGQLQPVSSKLNERDKAGQPAFSYFEAPTSSGAPYVNSGLATWILVLGIDFSSFGINGGAFQVKNAQGQVVNSLRGVQTTGVGELLEYLPLRWIIPPGGSLVSTSGSVSIFQGLQGTFEEVIKYL